MLNKTDKIEGGSMSSHHFLMFSVLCISVSYVFGYNWSDNPGDGSETNSYQISTPEQMNVIGGD